MNSTRKGIIWSGVERIFYQSIQFILTLVIARLVSPSDYGVVAMLTVFLAIAQVFVDSGFANALIQKKSRTEEDFSTVFWFNLLIGVTLFIILFFTSPAISRFYEMPELDLAMKVISLNLIVNAISIIQKTKLTIALNFKRQTYFSVTGVVISGIVGIVMALKGMGYWALVVQTLLNNTINSGLLWIYGRWKPLFRFSVSSLKSLFSFGSKLLFSSLLDVAYNNVYSLVIGKKYSSAELGYYNRAYMFGSFPFTNLCQIVTRVMYPSWCRMDKDEEMISSFLKTLRILSFIAIPIAVSMSILSGPIIRIVLTEKWMPMQPFFVIIAIALIAYPLTAINDNILKVKGRSDYFFRAEVIKKIVGISVLLFTLPFGILAICLGKGIYFLCGMVINMYYSRKTVKLKILTQFQVIMPIVAINLIAGIFFYLPTIFLKNDYLILITSLLLGGTIYLALGYKLNLVGFLKLKK